MCVAEQASTIVEPGKFEIFESKFLMPHFWWSDVHLNLSVCAFLRPRKTQQLLDTMAVRAAIEVNEKLIWPHAHEALPAPMNGFDC